MMDCKVTDLCRAVGGTLVQTGAETVCGVSTDSRRKAEGQLFIPLVGERFDAHDYLDQALENGAAGCFIARDVDHYLPGKFYIRVPDTKLALRDLAAWYRGLFDLPVIQVTGSAGKTTTKEMIAAVLGRHDTVLKTQGNLNNEIGTPLTLLGLEWEHWAAVIETGIDGFGDLTYLGPAVRPTVAVVTNIGDAHIENMGNTRQGVLRAKSEIFDFLQPGGLAVLNGDDALLNTLSLPFTTVRCGKSDGCDVRVTDIRQRGMEGMDCTVTTSKDVYRLSIPSPGEYMIYPASMAVAIGEHLGLSHQEIVEGAAAYLTTGRRMRRVKLPGDRLLVDDCYNANPQAMASALQILAGSPSTHKVAVLGDMGELGEVSYDAHLSVGRLAAQMDVDTVVAIGPKAAQIAQGAGAKAVHFDTVAEAMDTVRQLFTPGTTVLVKASHSMEFGKIAEELEQIDS